MSAQRYERVAGEDAEDQSSTPYPTSPPSYRSRASSRRPSQEHAPRSEQDHDLNEAFDAPSGDESDDENISDRRRLISSSRQPSRSPNSRGQDEGAEAGEAQERPAVGQRRVTEIPAFMPQAPSGRVVGGGNLANDGVWANLNAKPRAGDDVEEKPPTYEQAAADATPPYWETTVFSPYATTGNPDDVFVDGLLVGSLFSFVWNALISMSFQIPGFLLTYLLHTTHAAKHGSRAGLGITLVQYGFQMRFTAAVGGPADSGSPPSPDSPTNGVPDDPNAHNFDPDDVNGPAGGSGGASGGLTPADWISYILMIVGWFLLIRAVSDFMKARRQEALVRSSPDRGLGVAVIAEGERPESTV
ncbi:hypothetical protein KC331_g2130 [Hortaea werneckii]|uniref:Metal homeostatis protein bsd2 n=1 Tax=Hortaea werneckii TaxID=91943 RepID=A0A3M7CKG0_HORWE|nr:hypothetical protein KC354_g14910 [Hortaea werneckii]KAI7552079.1 hypothetical protein KC331_g2130 [Hortaea werneckii]KAI7713195.1 hypothetical protein KC353_g7733 [Hortaea werneckii]RMY52503.1 hypothetical protein D0863_14240 [Hortaea werneckii]